jgi:hypothetical protein
MAYVVKIERGAVNSRLLSVILVVMRVDGGDGVDEVDEVDRVDRGELLSYSMHKP